MTWGLRLVLGAVFLYSGFVKAVDPWGIQFKIADYFAAWGLSFSDGISLTAGCLLSGFEFLLGTMLILGAYRRLVAVSTVVFMSAMTILTLYIWIVDPVKDCGCFGEALIISNSATFWKNVVFLILSVSLFLFNSRVRPLIHHRFQWLTLIFTICYILSVQIVGYHIQPLVDFRPYPVGINLAEVVNESDPAEGIEFVYEKDGQRKTFDINNLPDETWTFVERIDPDNLENKASLAIFEGEEDVTSEVISSEGREFILTITDPAEHGLSRSEMANRLKAYADSTGASMIAVVAMSPDSIDSWVNYIGAEYDVYTAEDTDLKMLVRGEAGLILLEDGVIQWKVNLASVDPNFPTDDVGVDGIRPIENSGMLTRMTVTWLLLLFASYLLSRFYRHWYIHRQQRKKSGKTDETKDNAEIKS